MTDAQRATLLANARTHLERTTQGCVQYRQAGKGSEWKAALASLDALARDLAPPKPITPQLGPVVPGGVPVLDHDLTHATDGVPGYPAFDDGFGHVGMKVLAPETFKVTKLGQFVRRDGNPNGRSVYGTGASGIKWVFGHVENPPAIGATIKRGVAFCVISGNHESPHLHVGIDAQALIGHELLHHIDYTHGAPMIGAQLTKASL
jgi:hypothetical protein